MNHWNAHAYDRVHQSAHRPNHDRTTSTGAHRPQRHERMRYHHRHHHHKDAIGVIHQVHSEVNQTHQTELRTYHHTTKNRNHHITDPHDVHSITSATILENDNKLNEWYYYPNRHRDQNHRTVDIRQPVRTYDIQHVYQQNNKWDPDCKDDFTTTYSTQHGQTITVTVHRMDRQDNNQHDKSV